MEINESERMKITKDTKLADIVNHITADWRLTLDEDTGEERPPTWDERVSTASIRLRGVWGVRAGLVSFTGDETIEQAMRRAHQGSIYPWYEIDAIRRARKIEQYVAAWDLWRGKPRNISVENPLHCGAVIRGEA